MNQLVGNFISEDLRPFRVVEEEGFKALIQKMYPKY